LTPPSSFESIGFVWRLLRDCLPTKSNFAARGVFSSDVSACVSGCGHLETALFIVSYFWFYLAASARVDWCSLGGFS